MQAGCAITPTAEIFLDFDRSSMIQADSQGIDYVNIVALIDYIYRGIQATGDTASEVVLLQSVAHCRFIFNRHILS